MQGVFDLMILRVAEQETAGLAQAYGCNNGCGAKFGFIVAVPAHAVGAVAVEVAKYAVEGAAGFGLQAIAELLELVCKGHRIVAQAAVGVGCTFVAIPGSEAGLHDHFAKHADGLLLPVKQPELNQQYIGFGRKKPAGRIAQRCIVQVKGGMFVKHFTTFITSDMKKSLLLLFCITCTVNLVQAQPARSFGGASGPELRWALLHPQAARHAYASAQRARAATDSLLKAGVLTDGNGGQLDAFRHAYWMALCVQQLTPQKAERLGIAHEAANYRQFKRGRFEDGAQPDSMACEMDLFNNSTGIAIGLAFKFDKQPNKVSLITRIISAIQSGQLRILRKDAAGNYLTCSGSVIDNAAYKGKWNIPKCLVKSDNTP